MSKQAKLAALIHRVQEYAHGVGLVGPLGTRVKDAYCEYEAAPDDPPQPPEMPECVRALLGAIETFGVICKTSSYVKAVRDHYTKPLKIRVGGTYCDAIGETWTVVWENPETDKAWRFAAVNTKTGRTRAYDSNGVSDFSNGGNIVREVKQ